MPFQQWVHHLLTLLMFGCIAYYSFSFTIPSPQPNGKFHCQILCSGLNVSLVILSIFLLAWIPGGYGVFHTKLSDLVHSVAPRRETMKMECIIDTTKGDHEQCPSLPTLPSFESTNMFSRAPPALLPFATNPSDCPALPNLHPWYKW